jgi:hypothetical protein
MDMAFHDTRAIIPASDGLTLWFASKAPLHACYSPSFCCKRRKIE